MDINTDTEAGQIAALAKAAAERPVALIETPGNRTFAAVPDGYRLQDVTPDNAADVLLPDHIAQAVTLETAASLADYLATHKGDSTTLFASVARNEIVGVIDYHGKDSANHAKHRATLALPYSVEWGLWAGPGGIDGKLMGQLEFARFLEENAGDIRSPDAADLLEVVRDMQAIEKADFRAKVRTDSDNIDFAFTSTTEASTVNGVMEVPKRFIIEIPVYFDGRFVTLDARLRWRKTQDGLQLGVQLLRKEKVRQSMFKEVVETIASGADVPALFGVIDTQ